MTIKERIEKVQEFVSYGEDFDNYNRGYVSDVISEIADYNVDIYTSDLWAWAAENYEWVDEAMREFGTPQNFDILQVLKSGQFLKYETEMYDEISDLSEYWILMRLDELGVEEYTAETQEFICMHEFESNTQLENVLEEIKNFVKEMEV